MTASNAEQAIKKINNLRNAPRQKRAKGRVPDRRDGAVYQTTREIRLAVQAALATGRPLLIRGDPGSGKSSLAPFIARNLRWRYYEHVVTSQTQAGDLLWTFDSVKRLSDAMVKGQEDDKHLNDDDYVNPGVLWWVLDPESAQRRGAAKKGSVTDPARDPNEDTNKKRRSPHAVVLLDEIDKADPDVPNGLLVPLGSKQFQVDQTKAHVPAKAAVPAAEAKPAPLCLTMITTNEERELPPAFVRRCIMLHLKHPTPKELVVIAEKHLHDLGIDMTPKLTSLCTELANRTDLLRAEAKKQTTRAPSTAEYLDAIIARETLTKKLTEDDLIILERLVLSKQRDPRS